MALAIGGAHTVIVGGWFTAAAAVVGLVGGALAGARPGSAAFLMALAVVVAGLVAPGVMPAIADTIAVFLGYLAGGSLLLIGAILATVARNRATAGEVMKFSH